MLTLMHLTYHYRVKNMKGFLDSLAQKVNFVWNYCNDVQRQAVKARRVWLSGWDLGHLTAGSAQELGLHSHTITAVGQQYAQSRAQNKKLWLRWRGQKSLGWIPLKSTNLKYKNGTFTYMGRTFRVFEDRPFPGKVCCGSSFSQDSLGHWFLNVVTDIDAEPVRPGVKAVGIDLGLKDFATLSTGQKVTNPKTLSKYARKLAVAQRANKRRQAAKVHAKIKAVRKDFHHKLSTQIVKEFTHIAVGDVCAAGLAKTSLAKSVLDAGWSSFRNMLKYKAIKHGSTCVEVSERFTTQTCHICGQKAGPRGLTGLNEREWTCTCGVSHDRDINAACNILAVSGMTLLLREPDAREGQKSKSSSHFTLA